MLSAHRIFVPLFAVVASACSSAGSSGGGSTDAGPDAPSDATGDATTDAPADVASDSAPPDAGTEASVPSDSGSDGSSDASDAGVDTGSEAGLTGSFPGELAPPYTSSRCRFWGVTPPVIGASGEYALADSSEGLWVGSGTGTDVARFSGGTWFLSQLPSQNPADTSVLQMSGGTGWASALGQSISTGAFEHLYYHATGQPWTDTTTAPGAPATVVGYTYGAGADLMGISNGDVVRFDGSAWHTITCPTGAVTSADGPGDDLYVLNAAGIHHYDGSAWTDISNPTTPPFNSIMSLGNGELLTVVDGTGVDVYHRTTSGTWSDVLSCSTPGSSNAFRTGATAFVQVNGCNGSTTDGLYRFDPTTQAFDITVTPGVSAVAVDTQGNTYAISSNRANIPATSGLFEEAADGGFVLVPESIGVPFAWQDFGVVSGRSSSELYAASAQGGLLAFDGGSWAPLAVADAGASAIPAGVWQASDGTVIVAENVSPSSDTLAYEMHRYVGGSWTDDGTVTTGEENTLGLYHSNLDGRSSSDAYFGVTTDVFHWDGTSWKAMGLGNLHWCDGVTQLGLGVAPDFFIGCFSRSTGNSVLEWDGVTTPSTALAYGVWWMGAAGAPIIYAPTENGTSYGISWNSGGAWTPLPVAPPSSPSPPTGTDASHVLYFDNGTFTRWNGTAWSTYDDPVTNLVPGTFVAWTDGTNAAAQAFTGVILCDLGP